MYKDVKNYKYSFIKIKIIKNKFDVYWKKVLANINSWDCFCYLESIIHNKIEIDEEVVHGISTSSLKGWNVSEALYDRQMFSKGRFCRKCIRLVCFKSLSAG